MTRQQLAMHGAVSWFHYIVPFYQGVHRSALSSDDIIQIFLSLSPDRMAINSRSRFNQGKYQIITRSDRITIRGPYGEDAYGDSRFPLVTQIYLQPSQTSDETYIHITSRPTLRALMPVGLMGLLLTGGLFVVMSQSTSQAFAPTAWLLLLFPYAIIVLFFNIEIRILLYVLKRYIPF
ncbi:MAG TPA: hypothetical protein V6D20_05870 [Candidatus Obscuribacterales bacterium]